MNVSGKVVFVMLFAVALAFSVDPVAGVFAFLALVAATNREAVARAYRALDDAARRVERRIEQRGWLPTARGDATPVAVTTPHRNKEEDAVVTAPAAAPAPAAVTTPSINKRDADVVTLPQRSLFDPDAPRPARFAVPLGLDQTGAFRWLDFGSDALHIGLYGASGCGKDHLLRLWFAALLREPGVQWAILDGKGDWLTPNLARLPQMLFPPAGGYGDDGQRRILDAIGKVNEEAKRRFGLLLGAGVRSVDEYNQTAPDPLPLLVVLATDIIDVVDETERLLVALVSKARALGIRVIVSMQTPTGKRLEWRMNLSTLISGALVDGSQDAPALGVRDPKALRYRPSQLPPPPGERGLFVVRHNNEQFLVRTPALVGDFDARIDERVNDALLETLLVSDVTTPRINKRDASVVTAKPVPQRSDAQGRNEARDSASESAGTGVVPSQSPTVPVPDRPETGESARFGGFSEYGDWDGDEITPSQGVLMPQSASIPVPEHQQAPGRNDEGVSESEYDALLSALAAMQRAGLSRDQARALGARFRNDDWTRARALSSDCHNTL